MTDETAPLEIRFEVDTQPLADAMKDLAALSDAFGRQLTNGLRDAVVNGRSLEEVLQRIGLNLANMALSAGLRPLSGLLSGLLPRLFGGFGGLPFLAGDGVLASPGYFPQAGLAAVARETGLASGQPPPFRWEQGSMDEARGGAPVNVVFNVTTQDAASFRKSEAQVTGMLARAVSRGARTL